MSIPNDQPASNEEAPTGQNLIVLKAITIGLGVLLVFGMIAIAIRIGGVSEDLSDVETLTASGEYSVSLAEGETLAQSSMSSNKLMLDIEKDGRIDRIVVLDLQTGARIDVTLSQADGELSE